MGPQGAQPGVLVPVTLAVLTLVSVDLAFRPRAWQVQRPALALRSQLIAFAMVVVALAVALVAVVSWGLTGGTVSSRADLLWDALPQLIAGVVLFGLGGLVGMLHGRGDALARTDRAVDRAFTRLVHLGGYHHQRRGVTTISYIDASQPFACSIRQPNPRVLVTRGLVEALTSEQVEAVLAHEEHHLSARHDRHLRAARLAVACLPFLAACEAHERRIRLLVELAGDDHAAQRHGSLATAEALDRYCTLDPRCGAGERAQRIRAVHARR